MTRSMPRSLSMLLVMLTGCGDEGGDGAARFVERDSAGVVVAEGRAPSVEPTVLSTQVEITPVEGREETLFGNVVDLAVDENGRMYVLDQMAREVRVFEEDGSYVGPIGRAGQGPGELSAFAQSILVRGDTVLVSDAGNRNVQRFTRDGSFLSSEPQPGERSARTWWELRGGSYFLRSLTMAPGEDGTWRSADLVLRLDELGGLDTVAVLDYPVTDIGRRGAPKVPYIVNAPMWAPTADGGVAWTHLEADRIFVHGPGAALERTVRLLDWTLADATRGDLEALEELMREKLAMLGGDPAAVDNLPVVPPEHLPAITSLRAGPRGTLWVQRMGPLGAVHPMALNAPEPPTGWGGALWDVLDADGRPLLTARLPERFRLLDFAGDVAYGVRRSELDEEIVVALAVPPLP